MKRANHNTEGKFCQNLGSRPTPYPIVKRFSSAFWLTFPFQAQILESIPNMAVTVREIGLSLPSPARLGTTALNRSRICIRDFLECPQKCLCLPAQRAVPRMNHVEAAS